MPQIECKGSGKRARGILGSGQEDLPVTLVYNSKSSQKKGKNLVISLEIEGQKIEAVIDSAAQTSVIKKSITDHWGEGKKKSDLWLKGIGKDLVKGEYIEGVNIKVGEWEVVETIVSAPIEEDMLLGLDFLCKHGMAIDFSTNMIRFKDQVIRARVEGDGGGNQEEAVRQVSLKNKIKIPPNSVVYCIGWVDSPMGKPFVFAPDNGKIPCLMPFTFHRGGQCILMQCVNDTNKAMAIEKGVCLGTAMEGEEVRAHDEKKRADTVKVRLTKKLLDKEVQGELPEHLVALYERSCEGLNEDQMRQLKRLLIEYQDVFASHEFDLGCFTAVEHEIDLENNVAFREKMRRTPPGMEGEEEKHIKEMMDAGVIKHSESPFASAPVLIRKKDGKLRYCIDFRKLNSLTRKVCFALPLVSDCVDSLAGNKFMSTLDMASGYWQVRIKPEHGERTAFITKYGLYEFVRMPFGLCNAPSTFQRAMNLVLRGLTWKSALAFLDDVMVLGKTFEEHLANLEEVLGRFRQYNLKLKPKKCAFFRTKAKFLGRIVGENTVEIDPETIKPVSDWPVPKCTRDVESFLGFVNYHRDHLPNLAKVAGPLYDLTGKKTNFKWGEEQEQAFGELKNLLVSPQVLAIPQKEGMFVLDCDASNGAVGGELSQEQGGVLRPVGFGSKKLSPLQRRYCTTRKELLAVVTFTRQFRHYLIGKPFLVRTDHNSLTWLMRFKNIEGQLARWMEELQQYDMQVVHRKGVLHQNADSLSRQSEYQVECDCYRAGKKLESLPCGGCRYCQRMMETWERFEDEVDDVVPLATKEFLNSVSVRRLVTLEAGNNWMGGMSKEEWREGQQKDKSIQTITEWVENQVAPSQEDWQSQSKEVKDLWKGREQYFLEEGILWKKWEGENGTKNKLVVPKGLRELVMTLGHENVMAGHFASEKTLDKVREHYFWPGMTGDIETFVKGCLSCAKNKGGRKVRAPLAMFTAGAPMEKVHIDIVGPLPKSKKGNVYILVIVDQFTKWVEALPLPEQSAETVARAMVDEFITRMGCPEMIISDQGANFESRLFAQVCELLEIAKKRTTPYHPSANGQVERYNQTIIQMVRCAGLGKQSEWDEKLPLLVSAIRSTVNSTTGFTPNMLMLGREVRTPLQLMLPVKQRENKELLQYVQQLKGDMEMAHEKARDGLKRGQMRQKAHREPKANSPEYGVGDIVMLVNSASRVGESKKLSEKWLGPYLITQVISPILYRVSTRKAEKVVHVERLKGFSGRVPLWVRRKRHNLIKEGRKMVFCTCRGGDNGTPMVQCDSCADWFHCLCMGITLKEARAANTFVCPECNVNGVQT